MAPPWRPWRSLAPWGFLVVAALTFAAYWPALSGRMLWDDDAHVPRPALQSPAGLAQIWFDLGETQQYYPLLFSWFWVQHLLFGDTMLGYHVVNVLLHVVVAVLVYAVLRRLAIPGALLAAALFAVHPVHVESVAWVTEQKNTLSAVFYLSALLAYLRFDDTRSPGSYILSLLLFVAALLSKTVTATFPVAAWIILWWRRGHGANQGESPAPLSWRRDVLPLAPFFLLAAADGLLTMWFERTIIGARGVFELSGMERILLGGRAFWFYLGKLLWPANLMFVYPRWSLDPSQAWQWLFPLGTMAALVVCWSLRGRSRTPLAAFLLFVVTLAPVLGPLNVFFFWYSFVADHFQYLASLAVVVPVAAALAWALERLPRAARLWGIAGCSLLVVSLAAISWKQSHLYAQDSMHLYEATLEQNPDCWLVLNNMAGELLRRDENEQALEYCRRTARLQPDLPGLHNNFGLALSRLGRTDEALAEWRQSVRLHPEFLDARWNLGAYLLELGRFAEANQQLSVAAELDSDNAEIQNLLASALDGQGKRDEAIALLRETVAEHPDFVPGLSKLVGLLIKANRGPDAIPYCQHAIELDPESLPLRMALMFATVQANQVQESVEAAEEALELAKAQRKQDSIEQLQAWLEQNGGGNVNRPRRPGLKRPRDSAPIRGALGPRSRV